MDGIPPCSHGGPIEALGDCGLCCVVYWGIPPCSWKRSSKSAGRERVKRGGSSYTGLTRRPRLPERARDYPVLVLEIPAAICATEIPRISMGASTHDEQAPGAPVATSTTTTNRRRSPFGVERTIDECLELHDSNLMIPELPTAGITDVSKNHADSCP